MNTGEVVVKNVFDEIKIYYDKIYLSYDFVCNTSIKQLQRLHIYFSIKSGYYYSKSGADKYVY